MFQDKNRPSMVLLIGMALIAGLCFPAACSFAASDVQIAKSDLAAMSLEDLLNVEVTSVVKRPQPLNESAAAVYVITREDIRRSGATSIPETLRMVPGLEVARIDGSTWAVSARGFNGRFANKLLVMIDGRTVYNPLFSGVWWDEQDTLLEDIDRIEVIRGPGASLWGANAVNGVINIITRPATETIGGLLSAGSGTEEHGFGAVRYGTAVGDHSAMRVYAKYFDRGTALTDTEEKAHDDWRSLRGGFRLDSLPTTSDTITVQGDMFRTRAGETFNLALVSAIPPNVRVVTADNHVAGGNILTRWRHAFADDSETTLQFYYDRSERSMELFDTTVDTWDLDFQHSFMLTGAQRITWGAGYRIISDRVGNKFPISFTPDKETQDLISLFVQDEITLIPSALTLTVGSKFEHNDHTGIEIQPTIRLLWQPHEQHTLWGAVSRAVRTPSRADDDVRSNPYAYPGPLLFSVESNRSFQSEDLLAYEVGYRLKATSSLFFDAALFYNDYKHLHTVRSEPAYLEMAPAPPHLVLPNLQTNDMHGSTHGIELLADWQVVERLWHMQAAYTYLKATMDGPDPYNKDLAEGNNPESQVSLRSMLDLPKGVSLDLWGRYVSRLKNNDIGSYLTIDARIAWKPQPGLEIALVGQNLLHRSLLQGRPEFIDSASTAVERSVYGKVSWNF
jgi:iron complex outermembrane receptor protein